MDYYFYFGTPLKTFSSLGPDVVCHLLLDLNHFLHSLHSKLIISVAVFLHFEGES